MHTTTIESAFDSIVKTVEAKNYQSESWVSKDNGKTRIYLEAYNPLLKFYNRKKTHNVYPNKKIAKLARLNKKLAKMLPKPIMGSKELHGYIAKDIHYQVMTEIALKYGINGNAAILGGSRQAEIVVNFLPVVGRVHGLYVFFEKDRNIYDTLESYTTLLVQKTYETDDIHYVNGDIIDLLKKAAVYNYFSIFDFDFCGIMHIDHPALPSATSIADAIINSSTNRSIVSITSYNGRMPKKQLEKANKLLVAKLQQKFDILDQFSYQYWEGSPMETKILVLERKS